MSTGEPIRRVLGIDTSTLTAGLAVYGLDGLEASLQWQAGRAQTASLLHSIDVLLRLAGCRIGGIDAIAVATGPGSFNGLRVGLSTAKGLAYGLGCPIVGVPTLDVTAYPHRVAGKPVRAVLAAGRGRFVSALYRAERAQLRRVSDFNNHTLAQLATTIVEPTLLVGELDHHQAGQLLALAPLLEITSPAMRTRHAFALVELAWNRLVGGERDDPAALEPIYIHRVADVADELSVGAGFRRT